MSTKLGLSNYARGSPVSYTCRFGAGDLGVRVGDGIWVQMRPRLVINDVVFSMLQDRVSFTVL